MISEEVLTSGRGSEETPSSCVYVTVVKIYTIYRTKRNCFLGCLPTMQAKGVTPTQMISEEVLTSGRGSEETPSSCVYVKVDWEILNRETRRSFMDHLEA